MAADFNAGSIEGTLDLDTAPFTAGLAKGRQQAKDFEDSKITPKADLDKTEFDVKKDEATAAADKLGAKKVEPKADLDISEALAKYAILNKILDSGGLTKKTTGFLGGLGGFGRIATLVTGLLSVVAAAGPAGAAMAGFGAASVAALGGVYLSLGLFAGAFKSAFGEIEKANKAGVTLTGWAGKAQAALKSLTDGWNKLVGSVKPAMFHLMTQAFSGVAAILPKLHPLLEATTEGISHVVDSVLQLTRQPIFEHFLHTLSSFMGGFLSGAGPVLANLLHTFMALFIHLQPLMAMVGHGIQQASQAAEKFATGNGIEKFVHFAMKSIPPVMALVHNLVSGLSNLIGGLAPLAGPALHFIGTLVKAIGGLNITPLASGLGHVLKALEPVLGVASKLLNVVLKPLGQFLKALSDGPLAALTHSLAKNLEPAFKALSGMLHALVKPLAAVAGSLANLINPTGAKALAALMVGLQKPIEDLAPSLGKLIVALESLVDVGINMLIPILPTVTGLFTGIVDAIIPFINLAAKLLSFKPVAEIIIAIVAAMKAWALVQWALNAAMDANPIGLVIVALAALAVGIVALWQHSETFRKVVLATWGAVKTAATALAHAFISSYDWIKHATSDVVNALKTAWNWVKNAVANVVGFIRDHWQLLLGILTGPIGAAIIFLISHWAQIKQGFSNLMSDVTGIVSNGIQNVVGWFQGLPGKIANFAGQMLNAGKTLMSNVFHGIESVAANAGSFAASIASSIWGALKGLLNSIDLHIPIPHAPDINIHPFHLAAGGITNGVTNAIVGDNPGGREAVIPLDKYDLPRRGESDRNAQQSHADQRQIISLLSAMLSHLSGNNDGLAEAIANALDTHNTKMLRQLVQAGRAA